MKNIAIEVDKIHKDQIKFSIFAIILPIFLFFIYPISKNYIIEKYEINTEGMVEDKDKRERKDFLLSEAMIKLLKDDPKLMAEYQAMQEKYSYVT